MSRLSLPPSTTSRPPASQTAETPPPAEHRQGPPPLTFKLGERAFFVGHTGSGKTYLAREFIERIVPRRVPVVVIDPKREFEPHRPDDWHIAEELPRGWEREIRRKKRPKFLRLIIRPEWADDPRQDMRLNATYLRLFAEGDVLVMLDELQRLVRNNLAAPQLSQLVQMGRSRGIAVWGTTLRPSRIPREFISESDHVFSFFLRDKADRDRMAEVIGEWGKDNPGPGKHDLWYQPPGVAVPILVHQGQGKE